MESAFTRALGLGQGDVAALVGCGGKTALLHRLAEENRGGTVLLSTTTKILHPPARLLDRVLAPGEKPGRGINLLCRQEDAAGKLSGPTSDALAPLCPAGGLTLLECDGSAGKPLKGWTEHEPVIPPFATLTVGVCTLWPVGRPLTEALAHRLPLYRALTGGEPGKPVELAHIAAMADGMFQKAAGRRILLINQVETPAAMEQAHHLAGLLKGTGPEAILAGSVWRGIVRAIGGTA